MYKLASELLGDRLNLDSRYRDQNLSEGSISTFWLLDLINLKTYRSDLELKAISPNAYWYFETDTEVDVDALRKAIKGFETMIYPRVSDYFGQEWKPGIDDNPRLFLIHASLRGGLIGYFSSADEHNSFAAPFSNQREIIYLNIPALDLGTHSYLQVLAHELQHLIHWNHDPTEDTWINEGLSELSVTVGGFGYRNNPPFVGFTNQLTKSLVHWPMDKNLSAYYAGAGLFMHYLAEHYSSNGTLRNLIIEKANGIQGINNYLKTAGFKTSFKNIFQDWVIANLLDEDDGIYSYSSIDVRSKIGKIIESGASAKSSIPEYSVEYWEVKDFDNEVTLIFEGSSTASLIPVPVGDQGCWWSNSGDSIDSKMVVAIDLTNLINPVIKYDIWYDIEKHWDYGYIQISLDGGSKWTALSTPYTSDENPIGNSFGPAYTGVTRDWITETLDLKNYVNQENLLIRFQYITDDAMTGAGLCIKNIHPMDGEDLVHKDIKVELNGFNKRGGFIRPCIHINIGTC